MEKNQLKLIEQLIKITKEEKAEWEADKRKGFKLSNNTGVIYVDCNTSDEEDEEGNTIEVETCDLKLLNSEDAVIISITANDSQKEFKILKELFDQIDEYITSRTIDDFLSEYEEDVEDDEDNKDI